MAGRVIIMIGPSGAGKSVQAERLSRKHGMAYVSSGDLLRASQDPEVRQAVEAGKLVETRLIHEILDRYVRGLGGKDIVLDGFPRSLDEAIWLQQQMPVWGVELSKVIFIKVDKATAHGRIMSRGRHDDDSKTFDAKWAEYEASTLPVVEYYHKLGRLARVDGEGSVEEVKKLVEQAL